MASRYRVRPVRDLLIMVIWCWINACYKSPATGAALQELYVNTFGFESRAGQFTYPFLISGMLLVHRYVYPAYPEWRTAEFYLSMCLLGLYILTRKLIIGEARARWGRQIRMMEKGIEVYIGVSVVASLIFTLIMSMFGKVMF